MEAESFFHNRHMLSFQSGEINRSNRVDQTIPDMFSMSSGMENSSLLMPAERILHLDPVPELKHDTGLAMSWSLEEQLLLADGLSKYSNEPKITKYIKIAAMLQNKTVRDVAFRCRWMTNENRRRRKQEHHSGKMMRDYKVIRNSCFSSYPSSNAISPSQTVKQVECSMGENSGPVNRSLSAPSQSFAAHHPDCSTNGMACEASCVSCPMRHLLDENAQVLWQVKDNLDALKVQDNIHLLLHARNNLASVLDRMSRVAGLSQMNPLPIAVDESLFSKFLFLSPQVASRQEPRF